MRNPNDFGITTSSYQDEDRRWASAQMVADGTRETITLDGDLFTADFPDGVVPSGVVIGADIGALGGPYGGNASEVQTVTPATSGNTTVTFDGESTGAISIAADAGGATTLQTALEGLSNIDPGDVTVTVGSGATAGKLVVTFAGQYAGDNVPALAATGTGASAAVVTQGGSTAVDGTDMARGHLFTTATGVIAGAQIPAVVVRGPYIVHEDLLPDGHGLDDAAKQQLSEILYR